MLGGREDGGLDPGALSRRRLLAAGAAATAAAWLPSFRLDRAFAQAGCPTPPNFPAGIDLYRQGFENWAKTIIVDDLWTCAPRSTMEAVSVANWAHRNGYRVRPRGAMHGWSPFTVSADLDCDDRLILLDTTSHLTELELVSKSPAAVRAGAGAKMEALLSFLETHGLGITSVPATGEPTVAGVLAIGGHGAATPAAGERPPPGSSFGSISNLVVSIEAIVWSSRQRRYVARSFDRSDPLCGALLVNLGRSLITEVTLRAAPAENLRCVSYTDIPASELFAAPSASGRTFASFIEASGRAEAIWFPFTKSPWLKVWSVSTTKPPGSREVNSPYNYPFTDSVPEELADLISALVRGEQGVTPTFGQAEHAVVHRGLDATRSRDIWGAAKNTQLYIRATTLRVDELGYAVVTRRKEIQRVLHEFTNFFLRLQDRYQAEGRYPINSPLELRVSSIDRRGDVGLPGAVEPALSPMVPVPAKRNWDTVIWLNVLTLPGTEGAHRFYRELEQFIYGRYRGSYAIARPEWSKGWAFTSERGYADEQLLRDRIPASFRRGRPNGSNWGSARRQLNQLDPHRVFSNQFLDRLLP